MDEVIAENLSNLANIVLTHGSTLLIAAGQRSNYYYGSSIDSRSSRGADGEEKTGCFQVLSPPGLVNNKRASSPTVKPCPNCAEQLPITAIICGICDYNFLAERPGRGQKLLSSPQAMAQEMPEQKIVSTELIKPGETFGTVH